MKRRILLVDDDVAILLTLKAVLEISGFDVETAASAREAKSRIHTREYHMVITDMRMENEAAGTDVIQAARSAPYHPAVALLTAFPVDEEGWDGVGPDKILVKATQTRILLQQIEKLFSTHAAKLSRLAAQAAGTETPSKAPAKSAPAKSGSVKSPANPAAGSASGSLQKLAASAAAPKGKSTPAKASAARNPGKSSAKKSSAKSARP